MRVYDKLYAYAISYDCGGLSFSSTYLRPRRKSRSGSLRARRSTSRETYSYVSHGRASDLIRRRSSATRFPVGTSP